MLHTIKNDLRPRSAAQGLLEEEAAADLERALARQVADAGELARLQWGAEGLRAALADADCGEQALRGELDTARADIAAAVQAVADGDACAARAQGVHAAELAQLEEAAVAGHARLAAGAAAAQQQTARSEAALAEVREAREAEETRHAVAARQLAAAGELQARDAAECRALRGELARTQADAEGRHGALTAELAAAREEAGAAAMKAEAGESLAAQACRHLHATRCLLANSSRAVHPPRQRHQAGLSSPGGGAGRRRAGPSPSYP